MYSPTCGTLCRYHVYRVYGSGSAAASIRPLVDPVDPWDRDLIGMRMLI